MKLTDDMVMGKTGQKTKSEAVMDLMERDASELFLLDKGKFSEGFFVADSRCDHEIVMGASRNGMGHQ